MVFQENLSLRNLNTFGLNVSARWFAGFSSVDELKSIIADHRHASLPRLILGGGSNILFTKDFDGIVLQNKLSGITKIFEDDTSVILEAGAGINWHSLVLHSIENNYGGLENLSLIPGNTGAAPIQNIGAYGVEIKNTFHELSALNLTDGTIKFFNAADCRFGYRDSIFKHEIKNQFAIISVSFRLSKNPVVNTNYGAINEELNKRMITAPTIKDVSDAVISIRRSKLPDPAIIGNAGSFFKNPEIENHKFESLKTKFADIQGYPSKNKIKIPAGWLIEKSGWKGKRRGNVGMHASQALVLVNYGDATGEELISHAELVKEDVKNKFGIELETEVNII